MLKLSLFFLSLCINTAFACSCREYSDDLELEVYRAYVKSQAVVLAKAVNVKVEGDIEITEFITVRAWKGIQTNRFYTEINTMCCICGTSFTKGKEYLLYLSGPDDKGYFRTSMCTRTRPFSNALIPEIEILAKIWKKFPNFIKKRIIPQNKFLHNGV